MEIMCPTCKLKLDTKQHQRCPRCYTIVRVMKKCGDCNGCSLINTPKNNTKKCSNQD